MLRGTVVNVTTLWVLLPLEVASRLEGLHDLEGGVGVVGSVEQLARGEFAKCPIARGG